MHKHVKTCLLDRSSGGGGSGQWAVALVAAAAAAAAVEVTRFPECLGAEELQGRDSICNRTSGSVGVATGLMATAKSGDGRIHLCANLKPRGHRGCRDYELSLNPTSRSGDQDSSEARPVGLCATRYRCRPSRRSSMWLSIEEAADCFGDGGISSSKAHDLAVLGKPDLLELFPGLLAHARLECFLRFAVESMFVVICVHTASAACMVCTKCKARMLSRSVEFLRCGI